MSNDSSKLPADTPDTLPHPLVGLLITVAAFIGGSIAGGLIIELLLTITGGNRVDPPSLFGSGTVLQYVYMVAAYASMLAIAVACIRWGSYSLQAFGLRRPRLKDVGLAVLALVAYIGMYLVLAAVAAQVIPGLDLDQKQDIGFDQLQGVFALTAVFLMLVVVVPFVEEFLMRGVLFSSLRKKMPFVVAAIITSILFAVLHLGGGEAGAGPLWIAAIDTFVLSLVLCYLRERTGRLWAGIGLHAIKNSIAFAALFIFAGNS
jgi:membrane protease YdiL (CAAX protease family)